MQRKVYLQSQLGPLSALSHVKSSGLPNGLDPPPPPALPSHSPSSRRSVSLDVLKVWGPTQFETSEKKICSRFCWRMFWDASFKHHELFFKKPLNNPNWKRKTWTSKNQLYTSLLLSGSKTAPSTSDAVVKLAKDVVSSDSVSCSTCLKAVPLVSKESLGFDHKRKVMASLYTCTHIITYVFIYIYIYIYLRFHLGFSKFARFDPVSLEFFHIEIKTKKHTASDGNGFDSPWFCYPACVRGSGR